MDNFTPTNPDEESPELAEQRRSLDAMSAALTHNLNKMIAEQEQRVRVFAAQHPKAPVPGADLPKQTISRQRSEEPAVPVQQPSYTAPNPTPQAPPLPKKKAPQPAKTYTPPTHIPPPTPGQWHRPEKKKEGQLGPGCVITLIVVTLILLRACT